MTIAVISMIRDPWGGSEELWYDMAKSALRSGHTVVHLRFAHPQVAPKIRELEAAGAYCYQRPGYINHAVSRSHQLVQLGVNFLKKKLRSPLHKIFRHKPDLVLYNGTCYSIAQEKELLRWLFHTTTPFYLLGHLNSDIYRDINDYQASIIREAYGRSHKVFFVSERNLATASRHLCVPIQNAMVLRNPVNLSDTSLIAFPSINENVEWAVVGNLATAHKGQDILFQVLSGKKWLSRNWKLNIYGSGPDEQYLRNLSSHLGLENRVVFHGKVSDIRTVWSVNHMLLLPSHMEGMPLAVVEAMLCGRPCVVTDVGGNAEWIEEGVSGWIAPAATPYALEQTLERAWAQRECWQSIGEAARERAVSLYDPQAGSTLLELLIQTHAG